MWIYNVNDFDIIVSLNKREEFVSNDYNNLINTLSMSKIDKSVQ